MRDEENHTNSSNQVKTFITIMTITNMDFV